jgi:ATP-dependent RNA helicase RhlE
MQKETNGFHGLGIAPRLLEILEELGYTVPTPIQAQAIPVCLDRKDLVGIAQTGTGKTLAFGVPMLQLLAAHKCKGLVMLPTRELASQVDESLKTIGSKIGLRTAVLIGGEKGSKQLKDLKRNPHIVIATPGRLIDLAERKAVNLSETKILVLDEADMMLDMGFLPQIKQVLKQVPTERQTMLFSATMPSAIAQIASRYMSVPLRVEVAPAGTAAENVKQEIVIVDQPGKFAQLESVLSETRGAALVFVRTKHGVKNLTRKLKTAGFSAAEIHSDRSLPQRSEALKGFKLGKYRILVATDIAARGIDVQGIELVVNFDLPDNSEDYVHRIGRTGRAGLTGRAISFCRHSQLANVRSIERLTKQTLNVTSVSDETGERTPVSRKKTPTRSTARHFGSRRRRR